MHSLRAIGTYAVALCAAFTTLPSQISAAPTSVETRQSNAFWMGSIERQGTVWGNDNYKVFRNVKDYGAVGDGSADDTVAINAAISNAHEL